MKNDIKNKELQELSTPHVFCNHRLNFFRFGLTAIIHSHDHAPLQQLSKLNQAQRSNTALSCDALFVLWSAVSPASALQWR
jgi:hypothetical protein